MGILTRLRRAAGAVIASALAGPPLTMPPLLFGDLPADAPGPAAFQQSAAGYRFSLFRDYAGAPWAWTVESADGRLTAFHGSDLNRDVAVGEVRRWLTDVTSAESSLGPAAEPAPVDPPARAA